MERTTQTIPISQQMREKIKNGNSVHEEAEGNFSKVISTGSTLLDLAISGGRVRGGGLPGGIFVEVFGPESSGKTALICEIGGNIQKSGGECQYHDPEGRIDTQHALMFGFNITDKNYFQPDLVPQVFKPISEWQPAGDFIHGIFVDSLAALSTTQEMENEEGDKMGGRRAKEFSEGLRKTCRLLKQKNYLMVCSNQIRDTFATYGKKQDSPGGKAIKFYSSLRLQTDIVSKVKKTKTINGKAVERIVGVNIDVDVVKSSIWKPFRSAPITIIFDYGVDNIRTNIQFIKDYTKETTYTLGGKTIGKSMDDAIAYIEDNNFEETLKNEVIDLWEEVEQKFETERKSKK